MPGMKYKTPAMKKKAKPVRAAAKKKKMRRGRRYA
jgi:hypothetical protein